MLGLVAVLLSMYFTLRVERTAGAPRPSWHVVWDRFPKFVLGFVVGVVNDLRTWFLVPAFVSIGLEFQSSSVKEAGWRPVAVFAGATVINLVFGLALASLLFRGFVV